MRKFSVLMCVYYKENPEYLSQALESIWDMQILKPTEIVLVEDGILTPDLYLVIKEWKERLQNKFIIVPLEKNVGLGRAKNIGLKYCQYDYVAMMDSDDISLPERFLKQMEYIENNQNIAILGGQIIEFEENKQNKKIVPINYQEIYTKCVIRNPFNHMTVVIHKDTIINCGGYQHHLYMEDYNLWLRVIAAGYKCTNLSDVLVNVRAGNAMLSRRRGLEYIKSEFQLAKLKYSLKLQSLYLTSFYFLLRMIPRLLPIWCLGKIYKFIRHKLR
ncbi:amylovoran biosynthesis protein AmsE [Mergibacter septicus]|uniref:glycosyltransferase n=1 Tax=Mergibacter septicus TaxID=221402 RepID=UPI001178F2DC|nr:glycosyltransferase [Mergibacter septicus]AWX13213.1 amylovoran biosynthesis protein AmsE [Mergibacter septicus]